MRIIDILNSATPQRKYGSTATPLHVAKLLLVLEDKIVSRKELAKKLQLGEGSIRTILRKLRKQNIVEVLRAGCRLTERGKHVLKELRTHLPVIREITLKWLPWSKQIGILVKNVAKEIKSGIDERDLAIKYGADGLIVLVCYNSKLVIPSLENESIDYLRELKKNVQEVFRPEDGDVVIVSGASHTNKAELSALACALYLISKRF